MSKTYRNNGAFGALLDEYQRAVEDLYEVLVDVTDAELTLVVDESTEDLNCRSIQSILSHVISAGYNYIIEIRRSLGEDVDFISRLYFDDIQTYRDGLNAMFVFNQKLFDDHPNLKLEELDNNKKFEVRWKQLYDPEQLFEHAIVHVLRHRRQIEKFLIQIRKSDFS